MNKQLILYHKYLLSSIKNHTSEELNTSAPSPTYQGPIHLSLDPCAVWRGSCVVHWVTCAFLCGSRYTRHWLCDTNLQKRNRTKWAINWVDKSDPITSWPTEILSGSSALWVFCRHQKRSPNKKTHRSANTCEHHHWLPRLKRWGSDVWLQPLGKLKQRAGTPASSCWSNGRIL